MIFHPKSGILVIGVILPENSRRYGRVAMMIDHKRRDMSMNAESVHDMSDKSDMSGMNSVNSAYIVARVTVVGDRNRIGKGPMLVNTLDNMPGVLRKNKEGKGEEYGKEGEGLDNRLEVGDLVVVKLEHGSMCNYQKYTYWIGQAMGIVR